MCLSIQNEATILIQLICPFLLYILYILITLWRVTGKSELSQINNLSCKRINRSKCNNIGCVSDGSPFKGFLDSSSSPRVEKNAHCCNKFSNAIFRHTHARANIFIHTGTSKNNCVVLVLWNS